MSDLWSREDDLDEQESRPLAGGVVERQVRSVKQVNEEIAAAVAQAFPGTIWVRGEIQRFPADAERRSHVYFELHETGSSGAAEYQLAISLMGWDRKRYRLGRYLDGSDPDFQFANKLEVCLECKVDYYAKFGKLSLKVVGVDPNFALGRLEAQRRETLAYLQAHDLLRRNASLTLTDLPLRVGLITSPGSAAEHDFQTGLQAAPWAFEVTLVGARMQGAQLENEVVSALGKLAAREVDVIVLTRGGGSRADLSWFDQRALAEAIAGSPVPVVTAIGHEIDQAIADRVAHTSCKTPTAAAEFLVDRVGEAARRVEEAAERLQTVVGVIMAEAGERTDVAPRLERAVDDVLRRARLRYQAGAGRLQHVVGGSLAARQGRLADLRVRLGAAATEHLADGRSGLDGLSVAVATGVAALLKSRRRGLTEIQSRLARETDRACEPWQRTLDEFATQVRLLDPARLLRRGYSITLGPGGKAVRAASELGAGDRITSRFADGQAQSIVQPGGDSGPTPTGKARKSGSKKNKADTRQSTLFR